MIVAQGEALPIIQGAEAAMGFSNKTVLVTGAGSGLGRAIAIGFAQDGARVVGIGRHEAALAETRRLCGTDRMAFVVGDVASEADAAAAFALAKREFGPVDILVNNAAQYPKAAFLDGAFSDWRRAVDTNVIGTALCCRLALPDMLERGFGRIINVGTFAWLGPIANSSAYSASKAAIRPFTKSIALEIDRARYPDILVNEFIPGEFQTGMSERGEDPSAVYPHLKVVASLPRGGATGETFFKSEMLREPVSRRQRVKQLVSRLTLGLVKA